MKQTKHTRPFNNSVGFLPLLSLVPLVPNYLVYSSFVVIRIIIIRIIIRIVITRYLLSCLTNNPLKFNYNPSYIPSLKLHETLYKIK